MKKPDFDKCQKQEILHKDEEKIIFGIVHPQWGGYCSAATIEFGIQTGCSEGGPGCFGLTNWHDGDFAINSDDIEPFKVHCCSAEQFVDFGLSILEKQLANQKFGNDPISIDSDWVKGAVKRLEQLKGERETK